MVYIACQAPLSMGFPRQEYWNGLPFPPLGDLPNPGIEPLGLWHSCIAGGSFTTESPGKLLQFITFVYSFWGMEILVPQPVIRHGLPAVEA